MAEVRPVAAGNVISAFPFSAQEGPALLGKLNELGAEELWWLSGYAAGLAQRSAAAGAVQGALQNATAIANAPTTTETLSVPRATVLYGTATNNAKKIADNLKTELSQNGVEVRLSRLSDYKPKELANETLVYFVVSTQGEGEPPEDSIPFFKFLSGNRAPKLEKLKFAVLGLGDKSYAQFCQFGKSLESRLQALGAQALFTRFDADVAFEPVAAAFTQEVLKQLPQSNKNTANVLPLKTATTAPIYNKEHPFRAPILLVQKITARDSIKDIRHVELNLEGSGIQYQPGDAIGVWPQNPRSSVDTIIEAVQANGDEKISRENETHSLREWLTHKLEITQLAKPVLEKIAELSANDALLALLQSDEKALRAWIESHQLFDVFSEFAVSVSATQLVNTLRKLTPRLYSIASSQKAVGEEVHLTVAIVDDKATPTPRRGAASFYLSDLTDTDSIDIFIEHNDQFRLAPDDKDILLIGPGTGVAPFRAFAQEREETGATGKTWLFFGNPHFTSDFLYQTEWQAAHKAGVVNKISLAFSRDQKERIYVQHRLRENGAEVWQWLQNGAHIYVCGDASRMAADVHSALLDIAQVHGGLSTEQADDFLTDLMAEKRYQRDVY